MALRIKEVIKEKGTTIQAVADEIGINRVNLSSSINGNPTVETLEKIAKALDVSIVELFGESKQGFTALVDSNGTLYRANSIEELKCIISEIEAQE